MIARFSLNRRLHSLAEGAGPRDYAPHRPYTVALSDHAGEVLPFSLRTDRQPATRIQLPQNPSIEHD